MSDSILIFGGTFDPPHRAHVELPALAAAHLGCNRIIYIPARLNPLKTGSPPTPAEHRLAMLKLALRDSTAAEISTIELDRPSPSFTIDSLRQLRNRLGPDASFHLLIGADQALEFHRWKDWQELLKLVRPAVMLRAPWTRQSLRAALHKQYGQEEAQSWMSRIVDIPLIDVSASELRSRIADSDAVEGMDEAVLAYIRKHGLYAADR